MYKLSQIVYHLDNYSHFMQSSEVQTVSSFRQFYCQLWSGVNLFQDKGKSILRELQKTKQKQYDVSL